MTLSRGERVLSNKPYELETVNPDKQFSFAPHSGWQCAERSCTTADGSCDNFLNCTARSCAAQPILRDVSQSAREDCRIDARHARLRPPREGRRNVGEGRS